jgi:serine/threonine protein kinase
MKTNRKGNNINAKMHQMFIDNLKIYFKHLIIGLLKMHNNRIINKDIKQRNIMLYWQPSEKEDAKDAKDAKDTNNIMAIRYIDFGLSQFLTGEFCSDIQNIDLKGTPYYIPPELFVCAFIIKYKDRTESYQLKKIEKYIFEHVNKALNIINEKQIIVKLKSTINILYKKIKYLYEKDKLLFAYFGSDTNKYNGFLQKADVYALGLSIYETLYKYSSINVKQNEKLYDLLLHMIDMNSDTRYNVVQCLSHPYFTSKI